MPNVNLGKLWNIRRRFEKSSSRYDQGNTVKYPETFLACRLISLGKQPGFRPIVIGDVLRRIIGKVIIKLLKRDLLKATGSLQLCAGQDVGSEAVIHAVYEMFNKENRQY